MRVLIYSQKWYSLRPSFTVSVRKMNHNDNTKTPKDLYLGYLASGVLQGKCLFKVKRFHIRFFREKNV